MVISHIMGIVKLTGYKCERCGHRWVPRQTKKKPRVCPKCKSPYWDIPRKR
jgi:predicted Zn-ribbon and HTH transcriptional regulator